MHHLEEIIKDLKVQSELDRVLDTDMQQWTVINWLEVFTYYLRYSSIDYINEPSSGNRGVCCICGARPVSSGPSNRRTLIGVWFFNTDTASSIDEVKLIYNGDIKQSWRFNRDIISAEKFAKQVQRYLNLCV